MTPHGTTRSRVVALVVGLGTVFWLGCSDERDGLTAPPALPQFGVFGQQDIDRAIAAQERYSAALMRNPAVIGTAVGLLPNGRPAVRVFVTNPNVPDIPVELDGIPVSREVTGLFVAFSDPTTRERPAPIGYSVGHPAITAGTIGLRVVNGAGDVFFVSNNHVLANINNASVGDPALQPGPYDGGTVANDQIGTLAAFQPIDFSIGGQNTIDAAIAATTRANVDNASPADDGYGTPSATIFGDGNGDGIIDNKSSLLGLPVLKYGRTTKLTQGEVTGINAKVSICYEVWIIFCVLSADFQDQLIVEPGVFSAGGDSGSLIASIGGLEPVGLLFAGSETQTIANRIDLVLDHFGVSVDAGPSPPPTPVTDLAITSVSAPGSTTEGSTVDVVVTVRNVGTENVMSDFNVSLDDLTDSHLIGTESVAGLAPGTSTDVTFAWNTAGSSSGSHTLQGSHDFSDENAANDVKTTSVTVNPQGSGIHVGDLDGLTSDDGKTWSAIVEVAVHDANHVLINGAIVTGEWSANGLSSTVCTTGELGGNGTCIFLFPGLRKKSVSFTVTSVVMPGETYQSGNNHDPDGDSDGTTITVIRP